MDDDPKADKAVGQRRPEPISTVGAPRPVRHSEPPTPDVIGDYRILGKLGEGGMAVVFVAEQQHPRRKVALKLIRGDIFLDDGQIKMFQREAEALGRLKHPSIAAIYESGRTPGGRPYFAMELVRGRTLHDYLQDRPQPDSRAELEHRLEMFQEICEAVSYAHQRGVIHRDLKPSNIIVADRKRSDSAPSGHLPEIKILDFGLARLTDSDLQASVMTEIGVIKGTLPYMSPEQIRGDPREIDLRSDVYSLGVLLYEMLSGDRPYDTADKSMIEAARVICEEPPRPLQHGWSGAYHLDADIETIVGKALEKGADRRYGSASALAEDVSRYLHSQPILARPPSKIYQLRKFAQRHRGIVWGGAVTLIALVAGAVVATTFAVHEAGESRKWQRFAYQAAIGSSAEAIAQGDRLRARKLLLKEQVPRELRAWEWHVLWAQSAPLGITVAAPVVSESPAWVGLEGAQLVYLLDDESFRFDPLTGELISRGSLGLSARAGFPESPLWIEHGPGGYSAAVVDVNGMRRLHLFTPSGEQCGILDDVPFPNFAPAGAKLAYFGQPELNRVVIWDLATCSERLTIGWDWWLSQAVSSDGSKISLYKVGPGTSWGLTQVHDTSSGRLLGRFPVPSKPTLDLFTPDGTTLISATQEGDLRVMQLDPPADRPSIQAHDARIRAVAISSDGRQVATSADDNRVRLWELATHDLLAEYQVAGRSELLKFSPDDRFLFRVTNDNAVTVLDLAQRRDPRRLVGHGSYVHAAAIHPDGELIATGDWQGVVILWDARSGREVARLANLGQVIHAFRFSPDGSRLIGIGEAIHVWELSTGELVASLDGESAERGREAELPAAGTPLDRRADRIITGWRPTDATVEIWNQQTGERLRRPLDGLSLDSESWVSADGKFVVEAWVEPHKPPFLEIRKPDGSLHMRLATTGGRWWPFAISHGARRPLLAAPLKVASSDLAQSGSTVGVWELASKRKLGELRGHDNEVLALAFTPDDTRIATGSRDGTVRVWDPETFEEIAQFRGHRLYVKDLVFSPDGQRLVSTSGDGTAMIWDLVSVNERLQARRQQERDLAVAQPLVAALVDELTEVDSVVARLGERPELDDGVRREALRELLRVSLARQAAEVGADHHFILEPR